MKKFWASHLLFVFLTILMISGNVFFIFAQEKRAIIEQKEFLDPYGKKAVLGYLLRLPVFLDLLSAEIGLTEAQKDSLVQIVKSEEEQIQVLYLSSSKYTNKTYEEKYRQILLATDVKLRKLLDTLQYARLRDWIMEEWALERGEAGPEIGELTKLCTHETDLLKSKLNLSFQGEELFSVHARYKHEILTLRRDLLSLAKNPLTPWQELETKGGEIVQRVKMLSKEYEESILEVLSPEQRVIYRSLKQTQ